MDLPLDKKFLQFQGTTFNDKPVKLSIGVDGKKTLLLVFSPSCGYCKLNWTHWSDLVESNGGRTDVIYGDLSGNATGAFLTALGFQVSTANTLRIGPESRDVDALHVTPTTILIGADGKVENVWLGLLNKAQMAEIRLAMEDRPSNS